MSSLSKIDRAKAEVADDEPAVDVESDSSPIEDSSGSSWAVANDRDCRRIWACLEIQLSHRGVTYLPASSDLSASMLSGDEGRAFKTLDRSATLDASSSNGSERTSVPAPPGSLVLTRRYSSRIGQIDAILMMSVYSSAKEDVAELTGRFVAVPVHVPNPMGGRILLPDEVLLQRSLLLPAFGRIIEVDAQIGRHAPRRAPFAGVKISLQEMDIQDRYGEANHRAAGSRSQCTSIKVDTRRKIDRDSGFASEEDGGKVIDAELEEGHCTKSVMSSRR